MSVSNGAMAEGSTRANGSRDKLMLEGWVTSTEVREALKVHRSTISRWVASGKLPGYQFTDRGGYHFREEDWLAFIADAQVDPDEQEVA